MTDQITPEQATAGSETTRLLWTLMESRTRSAQHEAILQQASLEQADLEPLSQPSLWAATFWALMAADLLDSLATDWTTSQNGSDYRVQKLIATVFRDAAHAAAERQRNAGQNKDRLLNEALERADQALADSEDEPCRDQDGDQHDLLARCWRETMDLHAKVAFANFQRSDAPDDRRSYLGAHGAVFRQLANQLENPAIGLIAVAGEETRAEEHLAAEQQDPIQETMRLVTRQTSDLAHRSSTAIRETEILLALQNRPIDDLTTKQASEAAEAVAKLWDSIAAHSPRNQMLATRALHGRADAELVAKPHTLRQQGVRATAAALTEQVGLAAAQSGSTIRATAAAAVRAANLESLPRPRPTRATSSTHP